MALRDNKLNGFSFLHKDQPDVPNMTPDQFKAAVDSQAEELQAKHNSLIDELNNMNIVTQLDLSKLGIYTKITPQMFGAKADNAQDDLPAFIQADNAAAMNGMELFIPSGTYRLNGEFYPLSGMRGESSNSVILNFTHGGGGRSIRLYPATGQVGIPSTVRPARATATTSEVRAVLESQPDYMSYVTCKPTTDAAKFNVGDMVHIACGKNPFDADDTLYRYHTIWEIIKIDNATGRLYLNGMIDEPLSDDGWNPTSPYYNPPVWTPKAYNVGDVIHSTVDTGSGQTVGIFECITAGASPGPKLDNDMGTVGAPVWRRIAYNIGNLKNTPFLDGTPIAQKVNAYSHKYFGGFTINFVGNGTGDALTAIDIKAACFCDIEDINIKGNYAVGFGASEGVNNINFRNIRITGRGAWGVTQYRAFGFYSARNITVDNIFADSGSEIENVQAIVFLESYAKNIKIINSYLTRGKQFSGRCIFLTGGSEVIVTGNTFIGFDTIFRSNNGSVYSNNPYINHDGRVLICRDNVFTTSSRNFRYEGALTPGNIWAGNRFVLEYNAMLQPATVYFDAAEYKTIDFSFTPKAGIDQSNTDPNKFRGKESYIVLAMECFYDNPPAGAIADIRPLRRGTVDPTGFDASQLKLFSIDGATNRVLLTPESPYAYFDTKDGSVASLMLASNNDIFDIRTYNNAQAISGTIYVRFHVLVDRSYNKGKPYNFGLDMT